MSVCCGSRAPRPRARARRGSCRVSTTATDLGALTVDPERSNRWCQQHLASNSSERSCSASLNRPQPQPQRSVTVATAAMAPPLVAFADQTSYSYVTGGRVLSAAQRTASRPLCMPPTWQRCSLLDLGLVAVTAVCKL